MKNYSIRTGFLWKESEESQLLQEIHKGMSHLQIAKLHERTEGSIRGRLKNLALEMFTEEKLPFEQIYILTGINKHDIEFIHNNEKDRKEKKELKQKEKNKKKEKNNFKFVSDDIEHDNPKVVTEVTVVEKYKWNNAKNKTLTMENNVLEIVLLLKDLQRRTKRLEEKLLIMT